jgi:hypothetical protein
MLLILGSYLEINMFLKSSQVLFYILHVVKGGLVAHMDLLNTEGFDLKPDPIRFCIHNVWICS